MIAWGRVGVACRIPVQYTKNGSLVAATATVSYCDESLNWVTSQALTAGGQTGCYYIDIVPDAVGTWWGFVTTATDVDQKDMPFVINVEPANATPTGIAQAVWDVLTSALTTVGSIGKALAALITDYTTARAAKLDLIGTGSATYTSVVPTDSTTPMELVIGDDYLNAEGLAPTWNVTGYPTFVGGTAKWTITASGGTDTTYAATVSDADSIYVELTAAQTAAMASGRYKYEMVVKTAGGYFHTIATGLLDVKDRAVAAW